MIWFSSDYHIGHENIIRFAERPFADAAEMWEGIVKKHNEVVSKGDTVYLVGDTFWDKAHYTAEEMMRFIQRLNGNIILIEGNHDERSLRKFKNIPQIVETKFGDIPITVCHYPMLSWPKSYHGSVMVHGHTHQHNKLTRIPLRLVHIGVDSWDFYPASAEQVCAAVANLPNNSI
jgi:calcineurin-like phosphoesterase family protein